MQLKITNTMTIKISLHLRYAVIKPLEQREKVLIYNIHIWRIKIGRYLQKVGQPHINYVERIRPKVFKLLFVHKVWVGRDMFYFSRTKIGTTTI